MNLDVPPSLLGQDGTRALQSLMRQPALLAFDFDGTLAPLRPDPQSVYVSPLLATTLTHLNERLPVGVISGRQLSDLSPRLGFTPMLLAGNHGAEQRGDEASHAHWDRALAPARATLLRHHRLLDRARIRVEDKRQSLALHTGTADTSSHVHEDLQVLISELATVARVFGGHRVLNITPVSAPHKGDVMADAVSRFGVAAALYIGDDLTDEDVFRMAPAHWVTARVGPCHQGTAAQFTLDTHRDVECIITELSRLADVAVHA